MPTATLRKIGGSTVISLPPAFLSSIDAKVGDALHVTLVGDEIHLKPVRRKKYELNQLLDQYEVAVKNVAGPSTEDKEWLQDEPVGKELL